MYSLCAGAKRISQLSVSADGKRFQPASSRTRRIPVEPNRLRIRDADPVLPEKCDGGNATYLRIASVAHCS